MPADTNSDLLKTVRFLADHLDLVAGITPPFRVEGPPPLLTIVVSCGGARYIFKTQMTPGHVKARAAKLRRTGAKAAKLSERSLTAIRRKPPLPRRSRYSKTVADQFAADGELDNLREYRALYGLSADA